MEYQSSCAACHGMDAKGNGPVSKELKTRPADLTVLAKNNNGVFPYDTVYQMIDGRNTTIRSYELTDHEWAAVKPMLPNKPPGVARVNDTRQPRPKW